MLWLNGLTITPTIFPDKTSQIWKIPEDHLLSSNIIEWSFESEAEIIQLAQLKALSDLYAIRTELIMDYLPYARQDKNISNNQTFALHSFARILNSLNFYGIHIVDPHSDMARRVISNLKCSYPKSALKQALKAVNATAVCFPDAGATEKYTAVYKDIIENYPILTGDKVRDQSTGYITNYTLTGNPENHKVLIVDDICDGGMTFKILSKDLYAAGAKEVHLFVTHGIFSQGTQTLKESGIVRIFTAHKEVI